MTEMEQGSASAMESSGSQTTAPAEAPMQASAAPAPSPEERRFTQADLDKIAGKVRSETEQRMLNKLASQGYGQTPSTQPQQNYQSQPSADDFSQRFGQEFEKRTQEWAQQAEYARQQQEAERVAKDFYSKLNSGKSEIPDFDEALNGFDYGSVPNVVQLATQMDNTAAIMYEIAKDPMKGWQLNDMAAKSPALAQKAMQQLSQTIQRNREASSYASPHEPLSQMKPSNQGMDNKGALTVADYKRKYRI